MQITFTGDPQKDTAILQKAEELHILAIVEPDNEIEAKIRDAHVDFHGLQSGTGNPAGEAGKITVGFIR